MNGQAESGVGRVLARRVQPQGRGAATRRHAWGRHVHAPVARGARAVERHVTRDRAVAVTVDADPRAVLRRRDTRHRCVPGDEREPGSADVTPHGGAGTPGARGPDAHRPDRPHDPRGRGVTREKHDRSWWIAVLIVAALILAIPVAYLVGRAGRAGLLSALAGETVRADRERERADAEYHRGHADGAAELGAVSANADRLAGELAGARAALEREQAARLAAERAATALAGALERAGQLAGEAERGVGDAAGGVAAADGYLQRALDTARGLLAGIGQGDPGP